jgi:hypothetical protein
LALAVAKAGGDTWQNPETLMLSGQAVFTPFGQISPDKKMIFDQYKLFRVFPSENNAAHQANGKIRFDAFEGENCFFKLVFDGKKSNMFLSETAKPYEKHFSWSNNFGFSIIRFANRAGFVLERLSDDYVDGHACYILQITDPNQTQTVYGIDKTNFYIRYLAFKTEVGFHHRIYADFVKVPNVNFLQPTNLRIYFDGLKWMDISWQNFEVNQLIEDQIFE